MNKNLNKNVRMSFFAIFGVFFVLFAHGINAQQLNYKWNTNIGKSYQYRLNVSSNTNSGSEWVRQRMTAIITIQPVTSTEPLYPHKLLYSVGGAYVYQASNMKPTTETTTLPSGSFLYETMDSKGNVKTVTFLGDYSSMLQDPKVSSKISSSDAKAFLSGLMLFKLPNTNFTYVNQYENTNTPVATFLTPTPPQWVDKWTLLSSSETRGGVSCAKFSVVGSNSYSGRSGSLGEGVTMYNSSITHGTNGTMWFDVNRGIPVEWSTTYTVSSATSRVVGHGMDITKTVSGTTIISFSLIN